MMLLTLGLNHTTAPIAVREKLAFSAENTTDSLQQLAQLPAVNEAAILSTCNRTEIYCGLKDDRQDDLIDWLREHQQLQQHNLQQYLYSHTNIHAIRHMSRVACGLDSMILGEPQILGQMKSAYQTACQAGTLGKYLGKLFQHTFSVAKKVRTDTAIGSSPVSVAFAAVRLAHQIFGDLQQQTALLIGAGETIELTARHLHEHHIGRLIVANRTLEKAHVIAAQGNGYAIAIGELPEHLAEADIIVSSTASQLPILGKGSVESALKTRKHKPMFMVDLAVPHDIEPEVGQLNDVYLYNVDDLRNCIEEGMQTRREAAEKAEDIIDTQVSHFLGWLRAQDAVKTIQDMRQQAEHIRDDTLNKALLALKAGKSADDVVQRLAHRLTNKLIHQPSVNMREAGMQGDDLLLHNARQLFNLKK